MNCVNHPDLPATAFCRTCGKAVCAACQSTVQGTIFCAEHAPAAAATPPPSSGYASSTYASTSAPRTAIPNHDANPVIAALLGMIPGVGAIYNGQYAKGIVHALIFGLLVSIMSSGGANDLEPLFGVLLSVWFFYMVVEAYHTAKKRRDGEVVDEFSSLIRLGGSPGGFPTGAVTLIVIGALLLLQQFDLFSFHQLVRFWPLLLIFLGVSKLLSRDSSERPEVSSDRQ